MYWWIHCSKLVQAITQYIFPFIHDCIRGRFTSVHPHYCFRSDQESTFEADLPLYLTYWFASQTSLRACKLFFLDENKLKAVLIPLMGSLSMEPH